MNSEYDRYESFLAKQLESLSMLNEVACKEGMDTITALFGPFDPEELAYVESRLSDGDKTPINIFQGEMVFSLFYKYFQDPQVLKSIDSTDFVKLVVAARTILETSGLVMLPYIVSSKVIRLSTKKSLNRKELVKIQSSELYKKVKNKYKSDKIDKHIMTIIATILSSDFEIIDFGDPDLDGQRIEVIPELVGEEVLMYVDLI